MAEKLTMVGMVLIALAFGMLAVRLKGKALALGSVRERAVLTAVYSFGGYCLIGAGRLLLLRTGSFYAYAQDMRLFFVDVLMGAASLVFVPGAYLLNYCTRKGKHIFAAPICIVFTLAGVFLYQFAGYGNVVSAVYHSLLPEVISLAGLAVWFELVLISGISSRLSAPAAAREAGDAHRDKLSVIVSLALVITVFAYPFLETFLSNSKEFSFTLKDIFIYFALFLVMMFVITVSVLNNLTGRVRELSVLGVFAFTLAAYVQELFLNRRLFLMDGVNREWTVGFRILNVSVWCLIFAGVYLFRYFFGNHWKRAITFCCAAMAAMQAAGGFSLIITNSGRFETKRESEYFSTSGLNEAASEDNVIVFVLDKYDEKYMQEVLEKEPDFLEPLRGFVRFPDTVAQFSRTYPAITYMLTNHTFFHVPSGEHYVDWAFEDCSFWGDLAEQGFHMYFYEENASYIGKSVKERTDNYVEQGKIIKRDISLTGCIKSVHTVNCYKIMPYIVKDYFTYTDDTVNDLVIADKVWAEEQYEMDDAKIKEQLDQSGLVLNGDRRAFRFIHMFGAHPPYSLDREGNRVSESKDIYLDQYMGSMQIVYNYLDELKRLGLYENATIVITADHGDNFENGAELPEKVNVIMFVKPKGSSEEPLRYSETYAAQGDLLPTLAGETGVTAAKEWGIDLLSEGESSRERERFHYFHVVENMKQVAVRTYRINGSSLDFGNWTATDEYNVFQ